MDEEKTWGTILRALRGRDTQEKLVVKLEAYIIYSKKEISVFENDRRLPDRSTQVQFVRAFIDLGRIKSLEQANEWLKAGKSSDLDQNEINNLLDEGLITEAWLPQSKTVNDPLIEEIKDFRAQYLGTKFKERAPFGGRQKQLDELDRWLKDKAEPPYLLLTAPAGRGKSALLVHWSERLKSHPALFVIFVPVSINYETNSSEKIFRILTDYLATFHREQNTDDINTSTKDFGAEVSAYMRLPVPDTQKLVIIVDGVDEAADNLVGPTLFPAEPPSGLKVVVSARQIPDDSISWRDKLNWSSKLAQSLTLPPARPERN